MGKGDLINEDEKLKIPESATKKPERWKAGVSILVVVILAFFIIKWFIKILIPVLAVVLLIANRDITFKIIRAIYKLYQDETYKGLLGTLAAVVLFLPFLGFCFFRSVYYMAIAPPKKAVKEEKEDGTTELITIAVKEKVKNFLNADDDK